MTDFITADTVAQLTGYSSGAAFLKDRARLERDLGFPPPMPTIRRPLKWRAPTVRAWVEVWASAVAQAQAQGPNVVRFSAGARA